MSSTRLRLSARMRSTSSILPYFVEMVITAFVLRDTFCYRDHTHHASSVYVSVKLEMYRILRGCFLELVTQKVTSMLGYGVLACSNG